MKSFSHASAACTMIVAMGCSAWSHAPRAAPVPVDTLDFNGPHGFDFEFGEWHVHHRVKAPSGDHAWTQFDGMACDRPLMAGSANVEDNTFFKSSGTTHGVALRTYDARSGQWAIWWIDGRDPHAALDPPVKGSFVGGVGTFYSDGIIDGKPARTRFIWSHITPNSARWEQAYSLDAGKTWDTNWIMEFRRASKGGAAAGRVPLCAALGAVGL